MSEQRRGRIASQGGVGREMGQRGRIPGVKNAAGQWEIPLASCRPRT